MRNYTKLDLLRFRTFAESPENKDLNGIELLKKYDLEHPEKSSKEKLANLAKALGINNLHRAVTGEDIPESENWFVDKKK